MKTISLKQVHLCFFWQILPLNSSPLFKSKIYSTAILGGLFHGVLSSTCPLPCTTYSLETRHIRDYGGYRGFDVSFHDTVEVDVGDIKFEVMRFLQGDEDRDDETNVQ